MTNMASSGRPRRLDSQLKRLENMFPGSEIEGKVLFQSPSISTKGIKSTETQYIQRYYDLTGELPQQIPDTQTLTIKNEEVAMKLVMSKLFCEPGYHFDISHKVGNLVRDILREEILKKYGIDKIEPEYSLRLVISTNSNTHAVEI